MIAIVDYGAGNLASVAKAVKHLGRDCVVSAKPEDVNRADKVIIPGVGNFKATAPLTGGPLGAALRAVVAEHKPLLGICLGLQWLFEGSDEAAGLPGLGEFTGICVGFDARVKSPHVGWDQITIEPRSRLLCGVASGTYVYFTHSYSAPLCSETVATCTYPVPFTAAAEHGNVFGVQFHPEKSHDVGLTVMETFCAI